MLRCIDRLISHVTTIKLQFERGRGLEVSNPLVSFSLTGPSSISDNVQNGRIRANPEGCRWGPPSAWLAILLLSRLSTRTSSENCAPPNVLVTGKPAPFCMPWQCRITQSRFAASKNTEYRFMYKNVQCHRTECHVCRVYTYSDGTWISPVNLQAQNNCLSTQQGKHESFALIMSKQSCMCILRTDQGLLSWWRHQMETFSALLAIWAGNSLASGEFPAQRPVTRSFDVFFYLCLNKMLRKQSRLMIWDAIAPIMTSL